MVHKHLVPMGSRETQDKDRDVPFEWYWSWIHMGDGWAWAWEWAAVEMGRAEQQTSHLNSSLGAWKYAESAGMSTFVPDGTYVLLRPIVWRKTYPGVLARYQSIFLLPPQAVSTCGPLMKNPPRKFRLVLGVGAGEWGSCSAVRPVQWKNSGGFSTSSRDSERNISPGLQEAWMPSLFGYLLIPCMTLKGTMCTLSCIRHVDSKRGPLKPTPCNNTASFVGVCRVISGEANSIIVPSAQVLGPQRGQDTPWLWGEPAAHGRGQWECRASTSNCRELVQGTEEEN